MKSFVFVYFVIATALCVSHAPAKDNSFTEVRIPMRQRQVRLDVYKPNDPPSVRALRGESSTGLADSYGAAGQKPHPTILLLYGAGGLAFDGSRMRITAQKWASAGYLVYLVHYLDGTGGFMAMPWNMRQGFDEWVETVRDAIAWISKQPSCTTPIGVYAYSLGGFVGLEAASDNPQVGALVDFAGGWVERDMKPLGRMPPMLLVHGLRDQRVPYKKYVEPLFTYLNQNNIAYDSRVFPKQGHKFKPAELEDVRTQAIEFFRQHLKPTGSPTALSQRPKQPLDNQ